MPANSNVKLIQTGLSGLGFNPGPIDGLPGGQTRSAAEAWIETIQAATVAANVTRPASPPMLYQGSARHPVTEICGHCSATVSDWMADAPLEEQLAEIKRWHVTPVAEGGRGWKDIGYHWLISRDGRVLPGRAETVVGAGVAGHNQGVIHICLVGGHGSAATDRFLQHFTPAQNQALRRLMSDITGRTQIRLVTGHNQYANKACPGFFMPDFLKGEI